jgi:hypothetical protein
MDEQAEIDALAKELLAIVTGDKPPPESGSILADMLKAIRDEFADPPVLG